MSDCVDTIGIEDGSTANEGSQAAIEFYKILAEEITPEQLVSIWNKHMQAEEKRLAKITHSASHTLVGRNFRGLRSRLKNVIKPQIEKSIRIDSHGKMSLRTTAALPLWVDTVESKAQGVVGQKTSNSPKADSPKADSPKADSPKADSPKTSKGDKLSPTERAILLSTAGGGYGVATFDAASLPLNQKLEIDADLSRALEEATKEAKKQQDFVMWACQLADNELEKLIEKSHGEAIWNKAVTIESFPADPSLKLVFVRSSTAPMLGDHGPIVKHDYRAYGKAVTIHHDKMFRQLDGQRLIRSKTFKAKAHEYYVKALQYEEGMYFKGYFQVNGEDETSITKYLAVRKGKIVPITEQEYRECENRAAANYAPY